MSTSFETSHHNGEYGKRESAVPSPPSTANGAPVLPAYERLKQNLFRDKVTRLGVMFLDRYDDVHLKDLLVEEMDDQRRMKIAGRELFVDGSDDFRGRELYNFGSDSFLGLDRDRRVQQAIADALPHWGTHNGASRAFSSASLCAEAERRLAQWLGVEDTLIFTSVTLANIGLIPAIAVPGELLVVDRLSHDSIQQGARLAAAGGAIVKELSPCRGDTLRALLAAEKRKGCVLAVDGVYSMTGKIPPLPELNDVVREFGGVMYVDDAHGTGVVGDKGRGAASKVLGRLDDILLVGSLSKAFSCMGAFVTCNREIKRIFKIKSSTHIFGGPVPPPYLAGVCAVCDILDSPEGDQLIAHLRSLIERLTMGLENLGLRVLGGEAPIVSVLVGDIEKTLKAGKWLFDHGYYVQSATYPAVAINEGLLRIQVNANHSHEAIDGLLSAISDMRNVFSLPFARPAAVATA